MLKTVSAFDRIGEENAFAVLARANALIAQGHDVIEIRRSWHFDVAVRLY